MKKYNYLILLFLSFILSPHKSYADCTQEEINHFKEYEDKYKVTYEFNKDNKTYTLKLFNPLPNEFDYANESSEFISKCKHNDDYNIECTNVEMNNYIIDIVGLSDSCNEVLKQININLTKKNEFWTDPLCEGIEEFVLCQPTYDKDITYEEFTSRVATYKKTKISKPIETNNNTDNNDNKYINYLKDNLFEIIAISVFTIVLIVTIILVTKNIKKSRRLE